MALAPKTQDSSREALRHRTGQVGLDALMRDPRYWDGNHPDHDSVVDAVRRGFELVFTSPKERVPATVPVDPHALFPNDDDDPFARTLSRLLGHKNDLDSLSEAERSAIGRRAILAALEETGGAPAGLDDKDDAPPAARAGGNDMREAAEDDEDPGAEGKGLPWHPVDENGKEIPPHPEDPRFNPDGSPKKGWFGDSTAKRWAGRNSRYNPETGEFEYYADLPDFYRDPDNGGRWTKRDENRDKGAAPKKRPAVSDVAKPPPWPPVHPKPGSPEWRKALRHWGWKIIGWGVDQWNKWRQEEREKEEQRRR